MQCNGTRWDADCAAFQVASINSPAASVGHLLQSRFAPAQCSITEMHSPGSRESRDRMRSPYECASQGVIARRRTLMRS